MFKFYLDNNPVGNAINWNDFEENIVRDDTIRGLLPRYDIKLNFNGDGYSYIYNQYSTNGYCKLIELRIDIACSGGNYKPYFKGYIFISDCIFHINKCNVECSIIDDNYGARIFNNKSIKTYLDTSKSKNGETITNAVQQSMSFFSPWNVSYLPDPRNVIMLYDAFRFLVDFMTDGAVGFESEYLDYYTLENVKNDQANKVSIADGKELRLFQHTTTPFISFDDLFKEVNKKFPIMFTIIKNATGQPVIKIENEDYFYNVAPAITINNIPDIQQSFSNEKLYANIKFNAPYKEYDGTLYHFPQTRFLGFGKEEYFFTSLCNTDNTLDLTANFIHDSNIIEGVVDTDTTNDGYDTDVFFIEGMPLTPTSLARADFSPINGGQPWYYNQHFQNNFIAERHSLANDVALYLNDTLDEFMASNTATQVFNSPYPQTLSAPSISPNLAYESPVIAFQNDSVLPNFDTGGNYDNTVYKYTSPANGIYTFEVKINYLAAILYQDGATMFFVYNVYDASNVLQYTYFSSTTTYVHFPGSTAISGSLTSIDGFYLPQNYYVKISAAVAPITSNIFNDIAQFDIQTGSHFKTVATESGGGIYQENDPQSYFVSKYNFEYAIPNSTYDILRADLSKSITINSSPTTNKVCWIRKLDRKLATGETKWELISNINYAK